MRIAQRIISIVVGIVAFAACAHPVPTTEAAANPSSADDAPVAVLLPVVLEVDNRHSSDVEILVDHGGITTRLGMVTAQTTQTFRIPPAWIVPATTIALVARALGGNPTSSYRSGYVTVRPGQSIDLTLESGLQRSSYSVF